MKVRQQLPNALTFLRVLLCPFVIIFFLNGRELAGIGVFLVAAFTDFLDGYFARRLQAKSALGALLDPVCDKATTVAFFTLFMTVGSCPQWFLALVIATALLQGLAFFALKGPRHQGLSFEPLPLSKFNTALQLVWIGVVLCDFFLHKRFPENFRFSPAFHFTGYAGLALMQTVVFFQYTFHYRPFLFAEIRALSSKSA